MPKKKQGPVKRTLETVCADCNTDIIHWVHYAMAGTIPEPSSDKILPDWDINRKIFIHDDNISDIECDVIIVSCDKNLAPKGMGLIHKQAGKEFEKAAKKHAPKNVGDVIETGGYKLPSEHVFHVVTPAVQNNDKQTAISELETCYRNILQLMTEKGYKSIAIPPLNTGVGSSALSTKEIGKVALGVTRTWMEVNKNKVTSVIFHRLAEDVQVVYDTLLHHYFPVDKDKPEGR